MLYVFEDNEAVIEMIVKGRSPTMGHLSRTHRVAFNWLFDRINLDSKIQIRYTDAKHQLADILTEGNFTRDEWNNLLQLFNISHFSSTVHTLTCLLHAHFSAHSACTVTSAHFHAWAQARMAQVSVKRVFAHASYLSISPSPFSCLTRLQR